MKKLHGFHLIELLITLIIISLLAARSIPIYSAHLVHERRLEAAAMLSKLAIVLEQYHIEHLSYKGATLAGLKFPERIAKNNYQLIIKTASDDEYLLAAAPLNYQAKKDSNCATLTLDENSEKRITGTANIEECW